VFDLTVSRRIHLVGVGGAGMSALGKLLAAQGHRVSGSDLRLSPITQNLVDLGLEVWEGSNREAMKDVDLLVASSAVPDTDWEIAAAAEAGAEVWRRPKLLHALTSQIPTIGVTGTHGKTTSTALLVAATRGCGLDPSFIVGGELTDLRTNAHLGEDDLLVLEADEAFGTFTSLNLAGLSVTNVEGDHLEYYQSLDRLEDTFAEVVRNVAGPVVVGVDDPGGRRLAERTGRTTYGIAADAEWRIAELVERGESVSFSLIGPAGSIPVTVGRPGRHVARNAAGVLALLGELGHDVTVAAAAMPGFAGVKRRLETRARIDGVTLVDTYAHHPTEVAADLRAVGEGGWNRIWAVFQPHLYSRTELMAGEFGAAFTGADQVVVTDVYGSREAPRPGVSGTLVADAATARSGATVSYVPHRADVAGFLAERVEDGDLVLTMGAGDITLVPDELAALLAARTG